MIRTTSIPVTGRLRTILALALLAGAAAIGVLGLSTAQAQSATAATPLSNDELEELVGPIALYPDDLVAIVLPASTYPLQIVQAARFLDDRERDSSLAPNPDWDDSIVALLNYPEVVDLLNDDLDWTWELGEAVLDQRSGVLDAIQRFRDRAYAAGNLRSDERQVVNRDDGVIAIAPANPEVIYVPYYEPKRVVVYQPVPVYHYYPWSYPVYFYPYPVGYSFYSFRTGYFWGVTTAFGIGWHDHFVHVHPFGYHRHPYYGYRYYDPYYVRHGVNINVHINRSNYVWEPRYRRAAQPLARSEGRRVHAAADDQYRSQTRPETRSFVRQGTEQRQYRAQGQAQASRQNPERANPGTSQQAAGASAQPRQYRSQGQAQALRQRAESAQSANGASAPQPQYRPQGQGQAQALRQRQQPQAAVGAREQQATIPGTTRAPSAAPSTAVRQGAPARLGSVAPRTDSRAPIAQPAERSAAPAPEYRGRGMAQARESVRSGDSAPATARAPAAPQQNAAPQSSGRGGAANGGSQYRGSGGAAGGTRSSGHPAQRGTRSN